MTKLVLIYGSDFQAYPMGGIVEYVKNFACYSPPDIELYLVGLTLTPSVPRGQWRRLPIQETDYPFLPILYVNPSPRFRLPIPLNARFLRALRRYRQEILALNAPLYIQRAEHGLPFLKDRVPLFFNTHGYSGAIELQTNHPLYRYRWFRRWFYKMEARVIAKAEKVINVSPMDYEYYVGRFPQWQARFAYIPLGIETEFYAPPPGSREEEPGKAVAEKSPVVLFAGRFHPQKGLDLLIASFAKFRQWYPNAKLVLVGGSQDLNPIEEQVRLWIDEYGLKDAVELPGLLPRKQILPYYHAADLFIHTSLWEGLPTAVLEALASGLPVVATAVGGLPSVIQEDYNGYLVHERSPERVAEKMRQAYENRERLSRGALQTAARYSIRSHVEQVCQLVREASKA